MHKESGLYVHRELELRVNAARFRTPPEGAAPGAVSELEASEFTPLSVSSFYFAPVTDQQDGDTLLWHGVQHISKDAAAGKTSIGVTVTWDKEGAVTVKDALEIFRLPIPEAGQLNTWTPWMEATSRREGVFAWHAEVNRDAAESSLFITVLPTRVFCYGCTIAKPGVRLQMIFSPRSARGPIRRP